MIALGLYCSWMCNENSPLLGALKLCSLFDTANCHGWNKSSMLMTTMHCFVSGCIRPQTVTNCISVSSFTSSFRASVTSNEPLSVLFTKNAVSWGNAVCHLYHGIKKQNCDISQESGIKCFKMNITVRIRHFVLGQHTLFIDLTIIKSNI